MAHTLNHPLGVVPDGSVLIAVEGDAMAVADYVAYFIGSALLIQDRGPRSRAYYVIAPAPAVYAGHQNGANVPLFVQRHDGAPVNLQFSALLFQRMGERVDTFYLFPYPAVEPNGFLQCPEEKLQEEVQRLRDDAVDEPFDPDATWL